MNENETPDTPDSKETAAKLPLPNSAPLTQPPLTKDPSNSPSHKKPLKRIASLDFQRGLAIWMMVFLHVFNHMYDYSWIEIDTLFDGTAPTYLGIFFVLVAYLGGWAGYFILISGVVTAYTAVKAATKAEGKQASQLLLKHVLTGVGILFAGFITEGFCYYGYFGRIIRSGGSLFSAATWNNPTALSAIWRRVFLMEALQIIGWCEILNGVVLYVLLRGNGFQKAGLS